MLCSVIKGPHFEQARQQLALAMKNSSIAELRLDLFEYIDLDLIKRLKYEFPIPMIFTLRSQMQGGNYTGSEEDRIKLIRELLLLNPEYIDLEYNISPSFIHEIREKNPNIKIITSYHDFEKMPPLENILKEMQKIPADFYKMAFMLHSSAEALELLYFMKQYSAKVIAIGMGPFGESTRILGPIFGAKIVYGSIDQESTTAPGQIPIKALSEIYNIEALDENTQLFGLLGENVSKSLAHFAHNKAFFEQNLPYVYVKFPVNQLQLADFLKTARRSNFKALSVTMPLKEVVIPLIDEIDPWAEKIGAVNTLKFENGKIKGYNTDGIGALDAIEDKMKVKGKKMVFIGAGGAAKAIIGEALDRGALVTILNRDKNKALMLAEKMNCRGGPLEQISEEFKNGYDILINTTPNQMPIDGQWILPGRVVMDVKTQPQNTEFLREASNRGCTLVYGYEMFVNQAVEQFRIWFGDTVDLTKSQKIIEEAVLKNIQKD